MAPGDTLVILTETIGLVTSSYVTTVLITEVRANHVFWFPCSVEAPDKASGGDGTMVLLLHFHQIVSHEGGLHGVYCIFHTSVYLYNPLRNVLVKNHRSRDASLLISSLDHLPLTLLQNVTPSTNIAHFRQLWLHG